MSGDGRQVLVEGDLKTVLGYLGSSILFIGLFLPSAELPGGGTVNYIWHGGVQTTALLLVIAASFFGVLSRHFWSLWLTGGAAVALVLFTLARVAPGAGAARLQWGWPVLIVGAALVLAAAEVARRDGIVLPLRFRDAAIGASLLLFAVVIGPVLLSRTGKAVVEHETAKKQEERDRWEPHEYAREVMEATQEHVRDEESRKQQRVDEERRAAEIARQRVERDRRADRARLVTEIRRWYPQFAESLRPILDARRGFLEDYQTAGLDGARPACTAVEDRVRLARERLPRSPDRALQGQTARLLDLYLDSAAACRRDGPVAGALDDLERTEERIGAQLDEIAESLSTYCLRLPAGEPAIPELPAAMLGCSPRDRVAIVP